MDSGAIVTEADTAVEVRTAGAAHAAPATSFLREIPRVMCDVVLGLVFVFELRAPGAYAPLPRNEGEAQWG